MVCELFWWMPARDWARDPPENWPLPIGCLFTCWALVYLLDACLPVGCLFICRVLVYLAGAWLHVGCLSNYWVSIYLLRACLLVRCLFTCWVLVYLLGARLLAGCLFTCWVLVHLLGACLPVGWKYDMRASMTCALYYPGPWQHDDRDCCSRHRALVPSCPGMK